MCVCVFVFIPRLSHMHKHVSPLCPCTHTLFPASFSSLASSLTRSLTHSLPFSSYTRPPDSFSLPYSPILSPSIFPFPTSRPTSLFIHACPSIPPSTRLSIRPIPHSLFSNPTQRDPRHPVHPSLPCLRVPSPLSFHLFFLLPLLGCESMAGINNGEKTWKQKLPERK